MHRLSVQATGERWRIALVSAAAIHDLADIPIRLRPQPPQHRDRRRDGAASATSTLSTSRAERSGGAAGARAERRADSWRHVPHRWFRPAVIVAPAAAAGT